ncbi:MAG: hypothetical protein AB7E52_03210 [Bdellovibrionales bacterium]
MTNTTSLQAKALGLREEIHALIFSHYLRKGYAPHALINAHGLLGEIAFYDKYNPNWGAQPRAPQGTPTGGQWISGGAGVADTPDTAPASSPSSGSSPGRFGLPNEITHRPNIVLVSGPEKKPPVARSWKDKPNRSMREFIAKQEDPNVEKLDHHGYRTINKEGGIALGRYQFRNQGLRDIGLKDSKGAWRTDTKFYEKYHIRTDQDFLNNPEAQEETFTAYLARKKQNTKKLYRKYNGYTYRGILGEQITITKAGLLAAAHRAGERTVEDYLKYIQKRGGSYGLTLDQLKKISKFWPWVETRLRLFQDVAYTSSKWPEAIPDPRDKNE